MKQALVWWCLAEAGMSPEAIVRAATELGYTGVELAPAEYWPLLRENGLTIVSTRGHESLERGLNRRDEHRRIADEISANLRLAERWEIPILICFSGNRAGLDDRAGMENTAAGLRQVAPLAEAAGVTLALELLNSRVDHPDYQCDHTVWGLEVCRLVDSPRVQLLYDIYHMQIMEGDIIRTIERHHHWFAHYHTAGNPGRHKIGDDQELYYPAIARTIAATGYTGWIGQEFIPVGDPLPALRDAYARCDATAP